MSLVSGLYAEMSPQVRRAAEAGDCMGQLVLGLDCLKQGDSTNAEKWLRASAEQGNADAQLVLGIELLRGIRFTANPDEAESWLKRAESQGKEMATDILKNLAQRRAATTFVGSEEEVQEAAEKGDAKAEYSLALRCFARGDGADAVRWGERAAEKGHLKAQTLVGELLSRGAKGAPQDAARAEKWLQRAAEQGDPEACNSLAFLLLRGGRSEGIRWAREAAKFGSVDALDILGIAYGTGMGVKEDLVESLAWLDLAVAGGSKEAAARRAQCAEKAGAARVGAAKERSRELKAELEQAKARPPRPVDAAAN